MAVVDKTALKALIANTIGTGQNATGPEVKVILDNMVDSPAYIIEGIAELMSGERTSAATLTISNLTTVFTGASAATWTLPTGSAGIQWVRYRFDSIGAGTVTITRASTDTINGASDTTFTMNPFERGLVAYWDGVNWIIG